jgi:hypothetical protein
MEQKRGGDSALLGFSDMEITNFLVGRVSPFFGKYPALCFLIFF